VQKVRALRRAAKVSRRTLGFGLNSHRSSLVRRIAAKRTRLRCRVSASVCANSACSSGLRDLVLSEFPPKRFQGLGRKITGLFLFRPPAPQPRLLLQKTQAAALAPPSPAPQNTLRAQNRLRHHPAEVLVCLERGATGPCLSRSIANTPVGYCEATAATAGRSRPLQNQNLRPLGRPITTRAPSCSASGPPPPQLSAVNPNPRGRPRPPSASSPGVHGPRGTGVGVASGQWPHGILPGRYEITWAVLVVPGSWLV
jgi:hypothetical protein